MSLPRHAVLSAFSLLLLASTVQAASISAAWEIGSKGSRYDNFGHETGPVPYRGQTFVAAHSGPLTHVAIRMGRVGLPPAIMRLEVRGVDGNGMPTSELMDASEVAVELLPNFIDDVVDFAFAGTTQLEQSLGYALVLYPVPFHPTGDPYFLNGSEGAAATYSGGNAISSGDGVNWQSYADVDYGFEVRLGTGVRLEATSFGAIKQLY